ncbi:MAG: glutamyl-tRNA reductase [Rhodothermales bacterium]
MTFHAFGLNHETAPVQVRERFALDDAAARHLYAHLYAADVRDLVVLSTCNRTEVYLFGTEQDGVAVRSALGLQARQQWPEGTSFHYRDETAIRHMLHVVCGLNSLVLGDAQILSQAKDAYRLADDEGCVGAVMHRLMHTAFRAAKRTINETALTNGAATVSGIAVAATKAHFETTGGSGLCGRRALVVGAGQMGRLALQALAKEKSLAGLAVTNRSEERAQAAADLIGADVVAWEDRYRAVRDADVVIVATSAEEPVLQASVLRPRPAGKADVLLVDIAVPRNIERAVDALPGYTVIDLDRLNAKLVRVEAVRRQEVPKAEAICDELLGDFTTWFFHQQALQPTIHAIRATFEDIRLQEIERHRRRFAEGSEKELDRLTRSIMQKLLAVPVVRLKDVDPESVDFVRGIKLLHSLFARPTCEDAPAEAQDSERQEEQTPSAGCPFEVPQAVREGDLSPAVEEADLVVREQDAQRR